MVSDKKIIERSKIQALYKYLPDMWFSEETAVLKGISARVVNWNTNKMEGIYGDFIEKEIKRQITLFRERGGDISSFNLDPAISSFRIEEPACNDDYSDITAEISPLLYYCSSCNRVIQFSSANEAWNSGGKCPFKDCDKYAVCNNKTIKQLQMIYACECGHVEPVMVSKNLFHYKLFYDSKEAYKLYHYENNKKIYHELVIQCPDCKSHDINKLLYPDNASASRNYRPFSLHVINLVNDESGKFYAHGIDAQKTIIAKWFGELSDDDYKTILNEVDIHFHPSMRNRNNKQTLEEWFKSEYPDIDQSTIDPNILVQLWNSKVNSSNNISIIDRCVDYCNNLDLPKLSENGEDNFNWIGYYSFNLMQYETLKNPKQRITLQDIINNELKLDIIDNEKDIIDLNEKIGISNIQVSQDIEIINCTYGYTRKTEDPRNIPSKYSSSLKLKLNPFIKKGTEQRRVFGTKLITEGLLFEIDQVKIIKWLISNKIISDTQSPDLEDPVSVKKWFAEYVHGDIITGFNAIDESEMITKYVFSLLHSMSHAFIRTAGEMSGLSSTSLTEMIFVETASIFIYCQNSQGISLGALSGMAETRYKNFLEKTLEDNKKCVFDPICSERDDSVCSVCLLFPDVVCHYFNKDLGRKYLYTLNNTQNPLIGFWEI